MQKTAGWEKSEISREYVQWKRKRALGSWVRDLTSGVLVSHFCVEVQITSFLECYEDLMRSFVKRFAQCLVYCNCFKKCCGWEMYLCCVTQIHKEKDVWTDVVRQIQANRQKVASTPLCYATMPSCSPLTCKTGETRLLHTFHNGSSHSLKNVNDFRDNDLTNIQVYKDKN